MTYTELLNLLPGDIVITIYGYSAMVTDVIQQSKYVKLDIPNSNHSCCDYYRDYEIKCKVWDSPNDIEENYGVF